jgi:hypothetical protein
MAGLVEVIATVVSQDGVTKVFRFEFETEEDALGFLDTSNDPEGLVHVEALHA